ncbi:MAG: hypothetical protein ACOVOI_05635, partial [Hyphomicrobiales bacterium]
MAYADELDAVIAAEQGLRRRIAERIALEQGASGEGPLSPQHLAAADAAMMSDGGTCVPRIVINEVMSRGAGASDEFIELFNAGTCAVN